MAIVLLNYAGWMGTLHCQSPRFHHHQSLRSGFRADESDAGASP